MGMNATAYWLRKKAYNFRDCQGWAMGLKVTFLGSVAWSTWSRYLELLLSLGKGIDAREIDLKNLIKVVKGLKSNLSEEQLKRLAIAGEELKLWEREKLLRNDLADLKAFCIVLKKRMKEAHTICRAMEEAGLDVTRGRKKSKKRDIIK